MTKEQDEQASRRRFALSAAAQTRIDRILVYGGVAVAVALLGGVLLLVDPAQESASPTSTLAASTPTTQTTTSAPATPAPTSSAPPESDSVIDLSGFEPPDFDQIAKNDGTIEACRAWAEWNQPYNLTVSCEGRGSEVDVDCPVEAALLDMADCVTVGWANLDTYLHCTDAARAAFTATTDNPYDEFFMVLSAEDRARCVAAATSNGE